MEDLRGNILKYELQRELETAKALEKQGKLKAASTHYLKAGSLYRRLGFGSPADKAEDMLHMASQYESVAATVKTRGGEEVLYHTIIDSLVVTHRPETQWKDIGGLEEAKRVIKEAIILPFIKNKPEFVKAPKTILLYGPPGTGKTLLAKASSHTLDATFFDARISALLSKYFGESPKLVEALFAKAREKQPSLVFMDELDAIAISRSGDMHESTRRVLSQLLTEIDGFNTRTEDRVLIMAATNKPWDLDDAAVSRFQKKIYVPLPDVEARKQIIMIHLKGADISSLDLNTLAAITEHFSGRDLYHLCQEAIIHMVREQNPNLEQITGEEADTYSLTTRPLRHSDFDVAFEKIKPALLAIDLEKYAHWAEQAGG